MLRSIPYTLQHYRHNFYAKLDINILLTTIIPKQTTHAFTSIYLLLSSMLGDNTENVVQRHGGNQ